MRSCLRSNSKLLKLSAEGSEKMEAMNIEKKRIPRDPDSCDIPFYVSELVERELGTDCDSLSKLGKLIEQLTESKIKLEEQVSFINLSF